MYFTMQTAFLEAYKSNSNYGNKGQFAKNSNDLEMLFSFSENVPTAINTQDLNLLLSFGITKAKKAGGADKVTSHLQVSVWHRM